MSVTVPLLSVDSVRIDEGGLPAVEGLSLEARGPHALVLGAHRVLFEAASGVRACARGAVRIQGEPAAAALGEGGVAGAPLDPPLPPKMTVFEYVRWSARLSPAAAKGVGHDGATTKTLERLLMVEHQHTKLGAAPLALRRAAVVAAALATEAKVLVLEDPLQGLGDEVRTVLGKVLAEGLADVPWVLFAARVTLACPLVAAADEAVVVQGGAVSVEGTPAEVARAGDAFALRVRGDVPRFIDAVKAAGGGVTGSGGGLTVTLGPQQSPRALLSLALENGAVIVELRSLARAFG